MFVHSFILSHFRGTHSTKASNKSFMFRNDTGPLLFIFRCRLNCTGTSQGNANKLLGTREKILQEVLRHISVLCFALSFFYVNVWLQLVAFLKKEVEYSIDNITTHRLYTDTSPILPNQIIRIL